jgi:hypothetical protein
LPYEISLGLLKNFNRSNYSSSGTVEFDERKHEFVDHDWRVSTIQIGKHWANYYQFILSNRGISHYSIEPATGQPNFSSLFNPGDRYWLFEPNLIKEASMAVNPFKLQLFKGPKNIDTTKSKVEDFILAETHIVFLKGFSPFERLQVLSHDGSLNIGKTIIRPINYFAIEFERSFSLIDDTYELIYSVLNSVEFDYIDFLYFSAVTITTLGYGDIIPNGRLVRIYVMIETLFGVLIIGLFLSTFSTSEERFKLKRSPQSNNLPKG